MHVSANGDRLFAEVLAEALRRIDFECRQRDARVEILSCPANLKQEEVFRRLERVLSAHEAVLADLKTSEAICSGGPAEKPLISDLIGHADCHGNGVPESCVKYVMNAEDLPESLVRSLYEFCMSPDGVAKARLARELACFLR